MSTSSNTGSAVAAPPARQPRADAPRPQYLELKANVHRKLLNRLNLEALAYAERPRAEAEIRTLLFELIAEEGTPLSMTRARGRSSATSSTRSSASVRSSRCCATRGSATSWSTPTSTSTSSAAASSRSMPTTFQDDKHLMRVIDRIVSGVGRRVDDSSPMVDARLPGRLARQRDHSAARGRRPAALDPPFSGRAPQGGGPRRDPLDDAADARVPRALRALAS